MPPESSSWKSCWLLSCLLGICAVISAGCTTSYTPYSGVGSGYSETSITGDTYRVEFRGQPSSLPGELNAYLFYRCAELTLSRGATSFALLYGYNFRTHAVAIIRIGVFSEPSKKSTWYDAVRVKGELETVVRLQPHEIVNSPKLAFEAGAVSHLLSYPYSATTLDGRTYRLELEGQVDLANAKHVDHFLFYRAAAFAQARGADYFVVVSGNGRIGETKTGWGKSAGYIPYYHRSIAIRLFAGQKPTAFVSAFGVKDVLDSAGLELALTPNGSEDTHDGRPEQLSFLSSHVGDGEIDDRSTKVIEYREPGLLPLGRSAVELEQILMVRSAQLALDDGFDYFALTPINARVKPWQEFGQGDHRQNGYAGGVLEFYVHHVYEWLFSGGQARIREFRKGEVPAETFVYDAQDVLKNIGRRL